MKKKKFLFKADPYFKLRVFFLSQPMNKTDPSLKMFINLQIVSKKLLSNEKNKYKRKEIQKKMKISEIKKERLCNRIE